MLAQIAVLLGAIGTGMLALDVVKPKILASLRRAFGDMASHRLSPRFLFKREFDDKDHEALSAIKTVGFYGSVVATLCLYYFYEPSSDVVEKVMYYPLLIVGVMLTGFLVMNLSMRMGGWLISLGSYLALPLIYCFMVIFSIVSLVLQSPIKFVVDNEKIWFAENQAPRVLGLLLLFMSFVLQFFALKG
ncbi:hypothetical protein [Halomonas maura]|uniref:hypothetical protein n=1 Tax=Halomonas maura TaxID=117606 RepID=UPI0025B4B4C7|nr:hypothetical protein [Halomonas maura]MDN3556255.1 hypothetical protein [Halomonas maura]